MRRVSGDFYGWTIHRCCIEAPWPGHELDKKSYSVRAYREAWQGFIKTFSDGLHTAFKLPNLLGGSTAKLFCTLEDWELSWYFWSVFGDFRALTLFTRALPMSGKNGASKKRALHGTVRYLWLCSCLHYFDIGWCPFRTIIIGNDAISRRTLTVTWLLQNKILLMGA